MYGARAGSSNTSILVHVALRTCRHARLSEINCVTRVRVPLPRGSLHGCAVVRLVPTGYEPRTQHWTYTPLIQQVITKFIRSSRQCPRATVPTNCQPRHLPLRTAATPWDAPCRRKRPAHMCAKSQQCHGCSICACAFSSASAAAAPGSSTT